MKLDILKTAVTSKVGRQVLLGKKHSPTIMFAGGVVGVAGTVVLACRATLKVEEVLDDADKKRIQINTVVHEKYSEKDRKKDSLYLSIQTMAEVTKLYAPAVALGAVSIGLLTGSHVALTRRNVAATAAYAAVKESFSDYRDRVRADVGEERERELYRSVETREIHDTQAGKVIKEKYINPGGGKPSPYAVLFDERNANWNDVPEYNMLFLRAQQNYANHLLQSRGHVLLNDVLDALGMDRTTPGCVVGWVKGQGDDCVDFGIFDSSAMDRFYEFITGHEPIWLDFNVDGVIFEKI